MKRFVTAVAAILLVFICAAGVAKADPDTPTWVPMSLDSADLWWDITSPDGVHLWAVGLTGKVAASTDGGASWTVEKLGDWRLQSVDFVDPQNGWAAGDAIVLHTTNGGTTWSQEAVPISPGAWVTAGVDFVTPLHGWVWDYASCHVTTDGGSTWTAQPMPSKPREVQFLDSQNGWVLNGEGSTMSGDSPRVSRTTDGGATWDEVLAEQYARYYQLAVADAAHAWVETGSNLRATTDGGATWSTIPLMGVDGSDYQAVDATHLWTVYGIPGGVAASDDGGVTWVRRLSDPTFTMGLSTILVVGEKAWALGSPSMRTDKNGYGDLHPPVTTINPAGITIVDHDFVKQTTTWDLTAVDDKTGVAETWFRLNNDGAWQEGTAATIEVPADQATNVDYRIWASSRDGYGGWESPVSRLVTVDVTGPMPIFDPKKSYMIDHWTNRASYVAIGARDEGGVGPEKVIVSRDGGAWRTREVDWMCVTGAPKTHANDGTHRVTAHSVDRLENLGANQSFRVSIDTRKPKAKAPSVAHAKRGGTGIIKCEISDQRPCSGACAVQIRVYNQSGKLVGIIAPQVWFRSNRLLTISFKCPLKAGTYRFTVKGGDGAGNVSGLARNTLIVGSGSTAAAAALLPAPGAVDWLPADAASGGLLNGHVTSH